MKKKLIKILPIIGLTMIIVPMLILAAARALLTVYDGAAIGATPVWSVGVVADGQMFPNDGQVVLIAHNYDTTSRSLTLQTPQTVEGIAVGENIVAVPASTTKVIGPFSMATFNQSNGTIYLDYPAGEETHFSVCVIRVAKKAY